LGNDACNFCFVLLTGIAPPVGRVAIAVQFLLGGGVAELV